LKITYSFLSLSDLSDLSKGEKLLEILSSYNLTIEKADEHEPIRKEFTLSRFKEIWKGRRLEGEEFTSCYFLFKGKREIKFMGMASWAVGIHPNSKSFNGISLWLTIPKKYDVNKLIKLGDDLFVWSEAIYGYITEDSKDPTYNLQIGNVYDGLPGLLWVNYFGAPYLKEPDFHILKDHVLVSHGARLILSERPDDEKLSDIDFLENIKKQIGIEWFWSRPRRRDLKVPYFDRTAITRKEI